MNKNRTYEALLSSLHDELEALCGVSAILEQVNSALRDKRWEDYDRFMSAISAIGAKIERIENERGVLMRCKDNENGELRFYTFIADFEYAERCALGDVYRDMKKQVARIRSANNAVHDYLTAQMSLVTGIMEAAFPERRGKIYGRCGKPRNSDMRSMILNRAF
ncbi:MAG: hypothetical protein LBG72_02030 [Spirochaetaceae bacterium]|nr:hypothetical protein [Spirochaetaceae bacterium]